MFPRLPNLQRFKLGRVIVLLVVTLVLLQIIHMALLSRLEAREAAKNAGTSAGVGRQLQGRMLKDLLQDMHDRVKNSYRLDKSGTYLLIDNFLTSEHVVPQQAHDISLVTQCSSNHLHHVQELSERWKGPMSVALFTYDSDFSSTINTILHYHFCSDSVFKFVTFHLVFPISRSPKELDDFVKSAESKLSCSQPIVSRSPSLNYALKGIDYPQNLLRNLAINYVQTRYVLVMDVDMIPSEDFRVGFQKLLAREELQNSTSSSSAIAYVVPSFEIKEGLLPLPVTKAELIKFWSAGSVRPFYWELCAKCQRPTDYQRWRDLAHSYGLKVAYTVDWTDPWEPFYIARASLPLYDERFKQYGFNRISQVCEMHVAGYQFAVLDNSFLLHNGFKLQDGFHPSKNEEQNRNRELFRKFKEELKMKYPESSRRC